MLNIISRGILEKRTRGPQKVVRNLIAGLDQINYPYVINRALDTTNMLWIQDDISALSYIKSLPDRVKVIIGPNLFVNPEEIPNSLDLNRALYLQPSLNVERIWTQKDYPKSKMAVWAVGVDTDKYKPSDLEKEFVLLYFKNRSEKELSQVISVLQKNNIKYELIRYGHYVETEFQRLLSRSKYLIWLGGPESQGLALEEALSMNVAALVIDEGKDYMGVRLTGAPYFRENCGRKIENLDDFPAALSLVEKDWPSYQPRDFILQNLNLERQAHQFLNFFEDYFHKSVDEGKHEPLYNDGVWKNALWYYIAWYRLKDFLKKFKRH